MVVVKPMGGKHSQIKGLKMRQCLIGHKFIILYSLIKGLNFVLLLLLHDPDKFIFTIRLINPHINFIVVRPISGGHTQIKRFRRRQHPTCTYWCLTWIILIGFQFLMGACFSHFLYFVQIDSFNLLFFMHAWFQQFSSILDGSFH
jgi:hypothetical protein